MRDDQSTDTPQASSFIGKMSKAVENGRLQPSLMLKRHPKLPLGGHRIAGLGAEPHQQQVPGHSRSKKTLMHSLRIVSEEAGISSEALDKYATVFHNPLSETQIKTLVALFGWSPTVELAGQDA
jgi:hypothetical protein